MTARVDDWFTRRGFGAARAPRPRCNERLREFRTREMLSRALNLRTVVAFVGAGCSKALGFPLWKELDERLQARLKTRSEWKVWSAGYAQASGPQDYTVGADSHPFIFGRLFDKNHPWRDALRDAMLEEFRGAAPPTPPGPSTADSDPSSPSPPSPTVHANLKALQITRFATTNYDTELEWFLGRPVRPAGKPPQPCGPEPALMWMDAGGRHQLVEWPERLVEGGQACWRQHVVAVPGADRPTREFVNAERSFTQLPGNARQLAEFVIATARRDDDEMVFHLHGRCDLFDSMVISEAQYQSWYLNDEDEGRRDYRQTIELLLGSSPILFVGYGLGDEDLLRTLRTLGSTDARWKHSRPLFVLLHRAALRTDDESHRLVHEDYLYERYGVHVLWYGDHKSPDIRWSEDLSRALGDIKADWQAWQDEWVRKPKLRSVHTVPLVAPRSKVRYFAHHMPRRPGASKDKRPDLGVESVRSDLTAIASALKALDAGDATPRVLVLLGPGGTGKSHRAASVFYAVVGHGKPYSGVELPGYHGVFFWSSYYSDDWLNGVDRAISFLEHVPLSRADSESTSTGVDRLSRLRHLMRTRHALLIFDGFERLLEPTNAAETGRAYITPVREFLRTLCEDTPAQGTTVLLTTRLWPAEFGALTATEHRAGISWRRRRDARAQRRRPEWALSSWPPSAKLHRVQPLTAASVQDSLVPCTLIEHPEQRKKTACELASLLNGHAYALRILQSWLAQLNTVPSGAPLDECGDIVRKLQRTPPDRRVSRMVALAIEAWRARVGSEVDPAIASAFLERIALFMRPLTDAALDVCLARASASVPGCALKRAQHKRALRHLRDGLDRSDLLKAATTLEAGSRRKPTRQWTLHPIVRGYIFKRMHGSDSEDLPNFTLPGFTSGTAAVHPGSSAAGKIVVDLIDALIAKSRQLHPLPSTPGANASDPAARHLARAAFSVMRARMEAITVPRWTSYDRYVEIGVRMLNLVKDLSRPALWTHADARDAAMAGMDEPSVLHPEELAWLYNDLGLALCCEGSMRDAFAVWEQGYEINRIVEHGERSGHFVVQSKLHLAHTMLELGNIDVADQYLNETADANFVLGNDDFAARIRGYRGLLAHLRGNLEEAGECFDAAVASLRQPGGNRRAEAIFRRYRADLRIRRRMWGHADEDIAVSRSLSETSGDRDLVAYARKSLGHWHRAQGDHARARTEYQAALQVAREVGIRRLEADVLSELSHLALDLQDADSARRLALRGMQIANELGLGLRQCHGLVVLGAANLLAQQRDLGIGYLRAAYQMSRARGYWLRSADAEARLRAIGEPVEPASPKS